jgi:carboxyl-terminal processing protease
MNPTWIKLFDEAFRLVKFNLCCPYSEWNELYSKYRAFIENSPSRSDLNVILNNMLSEFQLSHTAYYTNADQEYYDLLDIFKESDLSAQIEKFFPRLNIFYVGIGATFSGISGERIVRSVLDGSPAEHAGLCPGCCVVTADGLPFEPIESFSTKDGQPVTLQIKYMPNDAITSVVVIPRVIRPADVYYSATHNSIRIYKEAHFAIGYIHMWSYAGEKFHQLLLQQMSFGRFREVDALVIDLRGGIGGACEEYLDVFQSEVEVRQKNLVSKVQWKKPVVLVVDNTTRSGNEVLAYRFKQRQIGTLLGEKTAGQVMFGRPFLLYDGSLLYLAVKEHRINGVRLEGSGVIPDIAVDTSMANRKCQDPFLEAAIAMARTACSKQL